MKSKGQSKDPIINASYAALRRAARRARALALATGTPLYIVRNGRLVNDNPNTKRKRKRPVVPL